MPCSRRMSVTGSPWERKSANSLIPPSWRNFSSTGSGLRWSLMTSSRPGTMYDVWRARPSRPSSSTPASLVKIWRSGQKWIRVPVLPLATRLPLRVRPDWAVKAGRRAVAGEDAGHAALERQSLLGRRAVDVDVHPRRQRVDDREADAVQATGGDVGAAAELAAGVQLGGDHLDAGQPGLGLLVGRDAAPVVVHLDRPVVVQGDLDPVRDARQRLVDAVVDDLPQAVHQPAGVGRADVHAGALAHGVEALEDQEVRCVVGVVRRCCHKEKTYPRHAVEQCRARCRPSGRGRSSVMTFASRNPGQQHRTEHGMRPRSWEQRRQAKQFSD